MYKILKVVFVLSIVAITSSSFIYQPSRQPTTSRQASIVTQIITLPSGNKKLSRSYKDVQNITALDLLKQTSDILVEGQNKEAFVTTIDGLQAKSEQREYWAFYVNGKLASVGAGSYKLQPNDSLEWKLEKY